MIVEISGAGFHNMGAELMLVAATEQLLAWRQVREVAVGFRTGSRAQRERVRCSGVLRLNSDNKPWANAAVALAARATPPRVLRTAGLLSPSAVGALLDASGFAYGDALDEWPAQRSARLYQSFTESGKPVILLPQAFGPFRRPNVAAATRAALEMAAMIIARDPDSLGHLRSLNLHSPEVRMAPDFTNLLQPRPDTQWNGVVALIPNMRMIDMGASLDEAKYVAFLKACALAAADAGYRVGVVAHEPGDRRLGRRVADDLDTEVLECRDTDPLATKALIGGCALVVSSRYHGLVNAMSQGVPAIGTGWSHKYSYLFDDYGCREALWDVSDVSSVRERLGQELQPHSLAARRESLREPAARLRGEADAMWGRVRAVLALQ